MSSRPSLVLDACELLRSLLFPFELCAPYVPRLTEPFMSCLEFPGAIFVGIHDDGCAKGLAATVRKAPPEDSILVDLDSGNMDCIGNRYDP
jgi:DENN (AEX-3) domain